MAFGRDVADVVTLDTSAPETLSVSGPFATKLEGENILAKTLALVRSEAAGSVTLGAVRLEKNLPIAAGLGGGSANAAALLRAIRLANPHLDQTFDWHALAVRLGADVAVCLESRASVMTGIGDVVTPLANPLPELFAVLANPLVPVPHDKTARVFRALNAQSFARAEATALPRALTHEGVIDFMQRDGNSLTAPASTVIPEISDVLSALGLLNSATFTALSGAGPTGFALFSESAHARAAAQDLAARNPHWWVVSTALM